MTDSPTSLLFRIPYLDAVSFRIGAPRVPGIPISISKPPICLLETFSRRKLFRINSLREKRK